PLCVEIGLDARDLSLEAGDARAHVMKLPGGRVHGSTQAGDAILASAYLSLQLARAGGVSDPGARGEKHDRSKSEQYGQTGTQRWSDWPSGFPHSKTERGVATPRGRAALLHRGREAASR